MKSHQVNQSIHIEGVGPLSDRASDFMYAEARRTHRSLEETVGRILKKALVIYAINSAAEALTEGPEQ